MEIEIRSNSEAVVRGYVNVVERYSNIIRHGGRTFYEKIKSGAFRESIKEAENENRAVSMLIDHNRNMVVAKTGQGLKLKEDNVGLFAEAVIHDENVIERARNGDAKGWSFGFVSKKDSYDKEGEEEIRTIEKLKLNEISLIFDKNPCYSATSVEIRAENGENVEYELEERGISDSIEVVENVVVPQKTEYKKSCEAYGKRIDILKLI